MALSTALSLAYRIGWMWYIDTQFYTRVSFLMVYSLEYSTTTAEVCRIHGEDTLRH